MDQPNAHPPGADRPVSIPRNIIDMRDKQLFNPDVFTDPIQRAEKQGEIVTPSITDVRNMGWSCGFCGDWNMPAEEPRGEKGRVGAVQAVVQKHQCGQCGQSLIRETEVQRAREHAREVVRAGEDRTAEHPLAIRIPGNEPSRKSMTDVLAGKEFRAA